MPRMVTLGALVALAALSGCGKKSTGPKDDPNGIVQIYFPLEVGGEWRYRVLHPAYDSIGTAVIAIVGTFSTTEFSGYTALDSSLFGMDTLWIFSRGDTVFWLYPRAGYAERRPILIDRNPRELWWQLYSVGSPGTAGRYSVLLRQRTSRDTVFSSRGEIYANCLRTDLLAAYEQSGDTVQLGSEYFARNVGRVLSAFRPLVESTPYALEMIR